MTNEHWEQPGKEIMITRGGMQPERCAERGKADSVAKGIRTGAMCKHCPDPQVAKCLEASIFSPSTCPWAIPQSLEQPEILLKGQLSQQPAAS